MKKQKKRTYKERRQIVHKYFTEDGKITELYVEKEVGLWGNSAYVILPRELVGKMIKIYYSVEENAK